MSQFNDHVSLGLPDKMNLIHNVISFWSRDVLWKLFLFCKLHATDIALVFMLTGLKQQHQARKKTPKIWSLPVCIIQLNHVSSQLQWHCNFVWNFSKFTTMAPDKMSPLFCLLELSSNFVPMFRLTAMPSSIPYYEKLINQITLNRTTLKLSFTNIRGICSNFVDFESFLELNSPDILALCETNLETQLIQAISLREVTFL